MVQKLKKYSVLMHLLFWGGYLSLSVFVFSGREDIDRAFLIGSILIVPQVIVAYINMEVLIPRYLIQKQYWKYVGLVLLCFAGFYLFYEYILPVVYDIFGFYEGRKDPNKKWIHGNPGTDSKQIFNPRRTMRLVYWFTQNFAIYFLSTAFKTSQIALRREKEAADLKSENLNSELKFLRSQINPHFLFNSLNNIYALSVSKSDKTPDTILKLSDMLRYIIYDCNSDRVPLGKELDYINNFVDLQKLKDDEMTNIKVDFSMADRNCMIAPMVFIPFIENSFKHSKIEDTENGWIRLSIENKDKDLQFSIRNSIPNENFTKDKVGGVGLENVKRRLELLYPNNHELKIDNLENEFVVQLNIKVKA